MDDQRVEEILDRQAIVDVAVRYTVALDTRDWALLRTCFVPGAIAEYGPMLGRSEGYEAIEAICRMALDGLDASQHMVSNFVVDLDSDRARSYCYFQAQHVRAGSPGGDNRIIAGTYTDELVRTPEGWRITERVLGVLWTEGNPAVLGG